jgi:hypothetical protein
MRDIWMSVQTSRARCGKRQDLAPLTSCCDAIVKKEIRVNVAREMSLARLRIKTTNRKNR